jgi:hypothetical protein
VQQKGRREVLKKRRGTNTPLYLAEPRAGRWASSEAIPGVNVVGPAVVARAFLEQIVVGEIVVQQVVVLQAVVGDSRGSWVPRGPGIENGTLTNPWARCV